MSFLFNSILKLSLAKRDTLVTGILTPEWIWGITMKQNERERLHVLIRAKTNRYFKRGWHGIFKNRAHGKCLICLTRKIYHPLTWTQFTSFSDTRFSVYLFYTTKPLDLLATKRKKIMKLIVACTHANFRVHFEKRPVAQSETSIKFINFD